MIKNKKAAILFNILIVFGTIVILTSAWIVIKYKESKFDEPIGAREIQLVKTYQRGENALFYVDQAAKLAIYQTIYDLAKQGGYKANSDCGTYLDSTLWNSENNDCFPEKPKIKESIKNSINENLNPFMKIYPDATLPLNNYEFSLKETSALEVTGSAKNNVNIVLEEQAIKGNIILGKGEFIWPLDDSSPYHLRVTSCFGQRSCKPLCYDETHEAIDISAKMGDNVLAVKEGTVKETGGDYNKVVLSHTGGIETYYLHNSVVLVSVGQAVNKGDIIAQVGGYGPKGPNQYPYHLHYAIKQNNAGIDPLAYYDIEKMDLSFLKSANCYYNIQNYPQYAELIKDNAIG